MIEDLAARFLNVSVCIAGDVMLDEYLIGSATRLSPEAPVPVLDVQSRSSVPGGAANVAANVASLGAAVVITGIAAQDPAGETLRRLLAAAGVSTTHLIDTGDRCTTSKTRIVAGRQQLVRIDHEVKTPVSGDAAIAVRTAGLDAALASQVLVLSDYAKGLLTAEYCAALIDACREKCLPVIVDPKSRDFARYRGCSVITPNLHEAELASGVRIDSEEALRQAGDRLMAALPGASILITRGPDGMTLFEEGKAPLTVPTVARQVFDVTGAGDTVVATLAVCLGAGIELPEAMKIANIAAGIVVDKPGTATTTVTEILSHDATRSLTQWT